jgi:hypothetical protein
LIDPPAAKVTVTVLLRLNGELPGVKKTAADMSDAVTMLEAGRTIVTEVVVSGGDAVAVEVTVAAPVFWRTVRPATSDEFGVLGSVAASSRTVIVRVCAEPDVFVRVTSDEVMIV